MLALLAAGLAACGAPMSPGAAAAPPGEAARWLLTWHAPVPAEGPGLTAFEAEAAAIARVPVRRVASVSPAVLAVTIACGSEAACAEANARLRADARVVDLVPDARRRTSAP